MQTMQNTLSERNRGRPAHITDFDLNLALHNLKNHRESPRRREWVTPAWQNYLFLGFLVVATWSIFAAYRYGEFESMPGPPWNYLLLGLAAVVLVSTFGILLAGVLHRGRLVLDLERRELRFYRSLLWPRVTARIALDDMAALVLRKLDATEIVDGGPAWTHRIFIVELRDGRLVSIAIDSAESILTAIRAANRILIPAVTGNAP